MDRENRLERERQPVTPLDSAQQERQQRSLPVVTVHDVRLEITEPQRLDDAFAKEDGSVRTVK